MLAYAGYKSRSIHRGHSVISSVTMVNDTKDFTELRKTSLPFSWIFPLSHHLTYLFFPFYPRVLCNFSFSLWTWGFPWFISINTWTSVEKAYKQACTLVYELNACYKTRSIYIEATVLWDQSTWLIMPFLKHPFTISNHKFEIYLVLKVFLSTSHWWSQNCCQCNYVLHKQVNKHDLTRISDASLQGFFFSVKFQDFLIKVFPAPV